jgi:hypothetical protein
MWSATGESLVSPKDPPQSQQVSASVRTLAAALRVCRRLDPVADRPGGLI